MDTAESLSQNVEEVDDLMKYPEMKAHRLEVQRIAKEVKEHHEAGRKFRIYHGSTNSTRPTATKSKHTVDTTSLNRVLRIDENKMRAIVQPNVPMDTLLVETLKKNMIPLVVTEFPGITVGGAFSGTAGESSSFKHGYFDSTVTNAEVVLANGEFFSCSKTESSDLFDGMPGSLGSIGVVTQLHIKLQRAYKYVEVTYHSVSNIKEAVDKLQSIFAEGSQSIDFLDGIMFSATKGAIITGRMVDGNPQLLPVQHFIRPKDPWYFTHVESRIDASPSGPVSELVPLPDYIFRYNRGIFWLGKQTFDLMGIRCTERVRKLTHHAFTARMGYARLHQQQVNTTLIQDLAIPFAAAEEFVQWVDQKYGIYPLWLCPLRVPSTPTLHPHHWKDGTPDAKTSDLMLNIGLYDVSGRTYDDWIKQNRELEDKVFDLGGMKWSYAAQIYSEEKFWQQHDREWYDWLREKYNASSLPSIYEKTHVNVEEGRRIVEDGQKQGWLGQNFGGLMAAARYGRAMVKSITGGAWKEERSRSGMSGRIPSR